MRKTITALAVPLCFSTIMLANAEATEAPNVSQGSNLAGEIIAVVGIVVIFAIVVYAGYRMVKKWSSPSD
jgi:hypothetical protein